MHHGCHTNSRITTSELLFRVQVFLVSTWTHTSTSCFTNDWWLLTRCAIASRILLHVRTRRALECASNMYWLTYKCPAGQPAVTHTCSVINNYKNFNQSLDVCARMYQDSLTLHHATWVLTPEAHHNQHLSLLITPSQLASLLASQLDSHYMGPTLGNKTPLLMRIPSFWT